MEESTVDNITPRAEKALQNEFPLTPSIAGITLPAKGGSRRGEAPQPEGAADLCGWPAPSSLMRAGGGKTARRSFGQQSALFRVEPITPGLLLINLRPATPLGQEALDVDFGTFALEGVEEGS